MDRYSLYIPEVEPGLLGKQGLYFNVPSARARDLFAFPMWGGKYWVDEPYAVDRDYMNSFLLLWIESGSMTFRFQDTAFRAGPNSVVLLDCKQPNHYAADELTCFSFLHYRGGSAQRLFAYATGGSRFLFPAIPDALAGLQGVLRLLAGTTEGHERDEALSLGIDRMLMALTRVRAHQHEVRRSGEPPRLVAEAVRYINQNYRSPLSVHDLAQRLGTSESQLSHMFTRVVGQPIHRFVVDCRVARGKHLLATTERPIGEIAEETGFGSASHFSAVFKKTTGMSPSAFRTSRA